MLFSVLTMKLLMGKKKLFLFKCFNTERGKVEKKGKKRRTMFLMLMKNQARDRETTAKPLLPYLPQI